MDSTAQKLQALLYAHGGEMKRSELASLLNTSKERIDEIAQQLEQQLEGQGIELVSTNESLSLRSGAAYADEVAQLQKKSSERDIGSAGLEVLAIVLYKGEVSRATIDYIRGVNSSGTLRQLVQRGLLERSRNADDARAWVYTSTPELLAHLGIKKRTELPEYESVTQSLSDPLATHEHE